MEILDNLKKAIAEHLDKLAAQEGLYVDAIHVRSEEIESDDGYSRAVSYPRKRDQYRRVISVRLTTDKPEYAK